MNSEISLILRIIELWWWVPMPFILYWRAQELYLWWRQEVWFDKLDYILLEIKIPKEVSKPLRAMEQVLNSIWGVIYDPPGTWKEKWINGQHLISFSLEVIGIDGIPHFFIRIPKIHRRVIESCIYSQYPEVEISLADDYTKYVPQDIPNKDWDIWGNDFRLVNEDIYPIKTYSKFFEEKIEIKEEKRLDPVAALLEALGKLKKGEQFWIQIIAKPLLTEGGFRERVKAKVDKLVNRPEAPKQKLIVQGAADILIKGEPPGMLPEKKEEIIPPEMRLTPGEREIVSAIEEKVSKHIFDVNIRAIYIAKRDVWYKPRVKTIFGFLGQFASMHLNAFKPLAKTKTKIVYWFKKRRLYYRQRRMFAKYKARVSPLFPFSGGTYVLNSEELATMFHFPSRVTAPAPFVPRIEAKKGEAPPGLPTE
ncbi:hypothetical protein AMJ49_05960 [Parcubacteria bacterium DG_74_2]|nr:MAG: hypothetical protein AMJ49_05960 [Parcubacteria bacterium DG_74_2]